MSLFDRQGIPEHLLRPNYLEDGEKEADFEDDISTLTSYSLIGMNTEGSEFEMHRLVQFSTKKWLELNDGLEHWKERYIEIIDQAFPTGYYEKWTTCQKLFPHTEMVLLYRLINENYLTLWASILFKSAWYSSEKGSYDKAEELNQRALEENKKVLGDEHLDTLASMNNLALTYWEQGSYDKAEEVNQRVLKGYKKALGDEHPDTLTSMANLTITYRKQGRLREAEELGVQVLEIRKRVLGDKHLDTLMSMANLASAYWDQGRLKEAEELGVQALEIRKRVLGDEHPDTLTSMANLAFTWKSDSRHADAYQLLEKCAQLQTRVLGANHPDTLSSLTRLLEWQTENLEISGSVEERPVCNSIVD
jgi:tetratricopeptide (TPR) repeat protein